MFSDCPIGRRSNVPTPTIFPYGILPITSFSGVSPSQDFKSAKRGLIVALLVALNCIRAQAQGAAANDPRQPGTVLTPAPQGEEFAAGTFAMLQDSNGSKRLSGFFQSANASLSGKRHLGALRFRDSSGDRVLADAPSHTALVKSPSGRVVALVSKDIAKHTVRTEFYDQNDHALATLSEQVVALTGNGRYAILAGYSRMAQIYDGRVLDLDSTPDRKNPHLYMADDSDDFALTYRHGRELIVKAFAGDGHVSWARAVMTGGTPAIRNIEFSGDDAYAAVVAGELPTDHLMMFDRRGHDLWKMDIPPGNYAMKFAPDNGSLLLIDRDGQMLLRAKDGSIIWNKPFPDQEVRDRGTLIATKILTFGGKFIVATRSVLSADAGKRPHETVNRIAGPDLVYSLTQEGAVRMILIQDAGTMLIEPGKFHYEPVVNVDSISHRFYYLTKGALRAKEIE